MNLIIFSVMFGLVSCQIKTGGVLKKEPTDPIFQKPALVAATHTDSQNSVSLSARYGQKYEIVAASTQVVSGTMYRLTLKFTNADNNVTLCDVAVLEKLWMDYIDLSGTPECRAENPNPQVLGGYRNVDSTSPAVQAAATFAVDAINKRSNSMYRNMLIEVVSAQQQVVAGTNYKLVLSVGGSSSCRQNSPKGLTLQNCPVDQHKQRCEVLVWDQPWRTPRYELTNFKCQ
ncbi:hypothetical protein ACJMK2_022595 [Sinanodonta woodiana]|uniref:Cystatin domain-containing protein n=1 Tax=Sinanodonta woodiana TaxID=1069815 RepID=A0ABD3TKL2_SINWO